jgi:hypothetical protein
MSCVEGETDENLNANKIPLCPELDENLIKKHLCQERRNETVS